MGPATGESFSLEFAGVTVGVRARGVDAGSAVRTLLWPLVGVRPPGPAPVTVEVTRGGASTVDPYVLGALSRTPALSFGEDGTALAILEYGADRVVALRHREADGADLLLTAYPDAGLLRIGVDEDTPAASRSIARQLKFVLGAIALNRGALVVHAAAVCAADRAVLVAGDRGAGKSSLSFLVSTGTDWSFVSDDLVFAFPDGAGATRIAGWPNRVAIGATVLADHPMRARLASAPLRRYRDGVPAFCRGESWSAEDRRRIYCDLDEFLRYSGAVAEPGAVAAGVVFPRAGRDRRGWSVTPVDAGDWVRRYAANVRQLKYATDFIGMLPRPPGPRWPGGELRSALRGLPAVELDYGPDLNADIKRCWHEVTGVLGI